MLLDQKDGALLTQEGSPSASRGRGPFIGKSALQYTISCQDTGGTVLLLENPSSTTKPGPYLKQSLAGDSTG